ncbi:acetyl-CoA carboxylase biotin carboxyl carrier protein [Clostridium cylindrosporum]|uniref:Biotin carboxyl carrier protein of acetyl-CoA carboxylase n=1 Tax=Clostridium cylindrosporum DSM 605 TaxID=1121307 RepID=A0A0J8DFX4_CLOCY|nr:acetyl-CoA carboxylase biotin carboxyl carrier protein [Clostridium cylindrosporum]KMT23134.1 biotin carboxyl carrier protein of acetyl-CoA carboxylase AccB [Clostridium cylindrosporum DSM 605]
MIDYREIEKLIKALDESSLTSLQIAYEGIQINMAKEAKEKVVYVNSSDVTVKEQAEVCTSIATETKEVKVEKRDENIKAIKSPIVGTFYGKPAPDKDAYVTEGSSVKNGQVVCIIEAMKLMNEVKSEFSGEIVKVLVNDGDLIEYGQEIFLVKES